MFMAPNFSGHVLEFSLVNQRVASPCLQVRDRNPTVVLAYGLNSNAEYPALSEAPGGVF